MVSRADQHRLGGAGAVLMGTDAPLKRASAWLIVGATGPRSQQPQ